MLMAVEHAPEDRRGFYGSWPQLGAPLGLVLGTLVFSIVSSLTTDAQLYAWGWRLPFLSSIILVIVGLWIRFTIAESPQFQKIKESKQEVKMPIIDAIRMHPKNILLAMGARFAENGFFYIYATFTLAYATQALGMNRQDILNGVLIAAAIEVFTIPAFGALSRPSRAAAGVYFRRHFLSCDVVPIIHTAGNQKPATWLDRDCSGSGRRPCRHVRPAGELPLRTIRDKSTLQRRVARLQSCVYLRRSTIAAHRRWAHDCLQAGDVADLRLYDRPGANHHRFGLFRDGNAAESRGLKAATPIIAASSRGARGRSRRQPTSV